MLLLYYTVVSESRYPARRLKRPTRRAAGLSAVPAAVLSIGDLVRDGADLSLRLALAKLQDARSSSRRGRAERRGHVGAAATWAGRRQGAALQLVHPGVPGGHRARGRVVAGGRLIGAAGDAVAFVFDSLRMSTERVDYSERTICIGNWPRAFCRRPVSDRLDQFIS